MRWLNTLSIRARITTGSVVIAIVFFAVAVIVVRFQVQTILDTTTETLLSQDTGQYVVEINADATPTIDRPARGQLVAVIDPQGVTTESTLPLGLTHRLSELVAIGEEPQSVTTADGTYLVLATTVFTSGGEWKIVAARNQESSALLLDRLSQVMVYGALALVVGFGGASWLLTSAALRPVSRMRREAELLSSAGSSASLPIGPAGDELSALAITLNEFIAQLRQSADRERLMISNASHELRTPIAVLKVQLELAHLNTGDAVALEQEIVAAQLSVDRLSSLASNLLELSRLNSGRDTARSSWDELSTELATSIDRARLVALSKNVTVDFEVGRRDTEATYNIPTANFSRLVDNLVSNAITAVPPNGSVRVMLSHSDSFLCLTVTDSGPGMPPEFMPIAFDRFTRADTSRSHTTGGSGLGLAIVHAIVTAADGTITLTGAEPAGLVVTVTLPASSEA